MMKETGKSVPDFLDFKPENYYFEIKQFLSDTLEFLEDHYRNNLNPSEFSKIKSGLIKTLNDINRTNKRKPED